MVINPVIATLAPRRRRAGKGASAFLISAARAAFPEIVVTGPRSRGKPIELGASTTLRRASSSTKPITSTACCSSTAWASLHTLAFLDEYARYWSKDWGD